MRNFVDCVSGLSMRSIYIIGMMVFAGCGGQSNPPMVKVSGIITLDGKPVPAGQIIFHDLAGQRDSAGTIKSGEYSFLSPPGQKKVEISWLKEEPGGKGTVGGIPGDPVSAENPAMITKEMIPARYNESSELSADVKKEGDHQFSFDLHTH